MWFSRKALLRDFIVLSILVVDTSLEAQSLSRHYPLNITHIKSVLHFSTIIYLVHKQYDARYEMFSSIPHVKSFQFGTKINKRRLMLKPTRHNENLLIFSVVNNHRLGVMLEVFLNCVGCEFFTIWNQLPSHFSRWEEMKHWHRKTTFCPLFCRLMMGPGKKNLDWYVLTGAI